MPGRYMYPGKAKVVFAPAVANPAAPTAPEISAGTVLTQPGSTVATGMKEMRNWETSAGTTPVPDVASTFDSTIPGRQSAGEPQIEFYDDDAASNAIRTALAEGTSGYVIIMPQGQTTGRRCEVWPVKVNTVNQNQVTNGADPATFTVTFAVPSAPTKTAVVP